MIYFLPWGGKDIASSRLRVYNVVPFMKDAVIGTPEKYQKGDVLIIQKALRPDEMTKAQAQGAKVIYDIDDNYMDKIEFVRMAEQADLVTVGSSFFHKFYPDAPVIDDSLDWDGTKKKDYTKSNLVGWHGYGNLNYIQAVAPVFEVKGMKVRTIVGEAYMGHYSRYDVKKWSLDTIDKDLAECDMGVIYLPEDDFSQAKGMNKLIKNWAIGLPCYFSYMPEYDRVVRESGIRGFMVRNWEMHDFSKPWVPEMRKYALKFKPENIAKQWYKAIELL